MIDLVLLPATKPADTTYGRTPTAIPGARAHPLPFPRLVWYNRTVRAEAAQMIAALGLARFVLVGFSKSGLGAWNLAQELPTPPLATIIFDAPMARRQLPPWQTAAFYRDDREWLVDLPLAQVAAGRWPPGRLLLCTGANFHDEMLACSTALRAAGAAHGLLPAPARVHHWDSGWLPEALARLAAPA